MQMVAKAPDAGAGPSGPRPQHRGGTIGARRTLPSGRAVLGALLVTVAAVAAFVTARTGEAEPTVAYVVAARALAPGDILTIADVRSVPIDLPVAQATSAFTEASQVLGSVARGPVAAGALLTDAVLEPSAPSASSPASETLHYREISFAVPRARALLGQLALGDRVDVVASDDVASVVLVQQALVVAVSSGSEHALVPSEDVVITLALPGAAEALAVAHGAAVSELTVLRSTRAEDRLADRFPPSSRPAALPGELEP